MVAAIRAGYMLLMTNQTQHVCKALYYIFITMMMLTISQQLQDRIQHLVKHFFRTLQDSEIWGEANDEEILNIPNMEDWESRPFVTHVTPIMTRQRYTVYLCWHLQLAGFNCFPIDYPIVPRGLSRLRVVFHAHNTEAEVEGLAAALCEWAREMLDIEESGVKGRLPAAARQIIASQEAEKQDTSINGVEKIKKTNGVHSIIVTA